MYFWSRIITHILVSFRDSAFEHVTLFNYSKSLFERPCHLQESETLFWTFKFIFPEKTQCKGEDWWGNGHVHGRKEFQTKSHDLPPSMHMRVSDHDARISFELQAHGKRSSKWPWKQTIKEKEELILRRRLSPKRRLIVLELEMNSRVSRRYEYEKPLKYHRFWDHLTGRGSRPCMSCLKGIFKPAKDRILPSLVCCRSGSITR
jgi:hypothetical protein